MSTAPEATVSTASACQEPHHGHEADVTRGNLVTRWHQDSHQTER